MNKVILSDDGIVLRDDALFQVVANLHFPESPYDIEVFIFLLEATRRRWLAFGKVDLEEGRIESAVAALINKRMARAGLCGLIALTMFQHDDVGKSMSLQSAAKVVSEMAYRIGKGEREIFTKGGSVVRKFAIPADLADVKKAFRQFQSVAHICAASVLWSEHEDNRPVHHIAADQASRFLQTVAHFQRKLEKAAGSSRWDLLDIAGAMPKSIAHLAPYPITSELISDIFGP